jgi:26S proteasome regulatory subunit T6
VVVKTRRKLIVFCQTYYQNKIEAAELDITKKTQNLRRLEAQRNALNTRGQL